MYPFIESICALNGYAMNLELHQQRVDKTFNKFYDTDPLQLKPIIEVPSGKGRLKCRLLYNESDFKIEWNNYQVRKIESIKLVYDDQVEYPFKFHDRRNLETLYRQKGNCDEILIVKGGLLTDTFNYNVFLYDGKTWVTPGNPLLEGIKRQELINKHGIKLLDITPDDLGEFQYISLINAMTDLGEIRIPTSKIYQ